MEPKARRVHFQGQGATPGSHTSHMLSTELDAARNARGHTRERGAQASQCLCRSFLKELASGPDSTGWAKGCYSHLLGDNFFLLKSLYLHLGF